MFKKIYISLFISTVLVAFPFLVFAQKDVVIFSIVAFNDVDGTAIKKSEIIFSIDDDPLILSFKSDPALDKTIAYQSKRQ